MKINKKKLRVRETIAQITISLGTHTFYMKKETKFLGLRNLDKFKNFSS